MEYKSYTALISLILLQLFEIEGGSEEKRLLRHLFDPTRSDAHDILERPVSNENYSVEVRMRAHLIQIVDVDEKNQIIQLSMWLHMIWNDYHFHWDPRLYGGVTEVNVSPDKLWKPDIIVFNSADERFSVGYNPNIRIHYNSKVRWSPPDVFKTTCYMDVTWFPFDKQRCSVIFGSWTFDRSKIDLRLDCLGPYNPHSHANCTTVGHINLEDYKKNGEFNLIESTMEREQYMYDNDTFVNIILNIGIQRKSLYYMFNFILPCIIVSIMAMLVFVLPPDSGEKISLGVTVLLSMTMFLLLVADKLPQTSKAVPLICKYFLCIMVACSLSIFFTVIVLNYHHRTTRYQHVPTFIRIVINRWIGNILLMRGAEQRIEGRIIHEKKKNVVVTTDQTNDVAASIDERMKLPDKDLIDDIFDATTTEWKFAARVIDRLCLIVFSLFTIIATIVFFLHGRHL